MANDNPCPELCLPECLIIEWGEAQAKAICFERVYWSMNREYMLTGSESDEFPEDALTKFDRHFQATLAVMVPIVGGFICPTPATGTQLASLSLAVQSSIQLRHVLDAGYDAMDKGYGILSPAQSNAASLALKKLNQFAEKALMAVAHRQPVT